MAGMKHNVMSKATTPVPSFLRSFEFMEYHVEAAYNGVQGLQMIPESDYHAVILDVMMPQINGFEVLKRFRKESDIPVLMLSARGDETDRIAGIEMKADDYLSRPSPL
jgi:two-component system response regulator CpxR